jgi:hypothetical protein
LPFGYLEKRILRIQLDLKLLTSAVNVLPQKHQHLKVCEEYGSMKFDFQSMLDCIEDELLLWN